jgi:hypothetical protein
MRIWAIDQLLIALNDFPASSEKCHGNYTMDCLKDFFFIYLFIHHLPFTFSSGYFKNIISKDKMQYFDNFRC